MPLILVYNPVCGPGLANKLVDNHILPLLAQHGLSTKVVATEYTGHAGIIIADYLKECSPSEGDLNVIIVSGDGTVNEIINYLSSLSPSNTLPRISFILVPAGTANALYSTLFVPQSADQLSTVDYKLQSLSFFIDRRAPKPLTLFTTNLFAPLGIVKKPTVAISAVVTSTSLHASILRDSEDLRKEIPGIERFKVAAQQNSKRWYDASVMLLPCPSLGTVQLYDPQLARFVDYPDPKLKEPVIELAGPFFYFLSTVNVDRLEPEFRITPLARSIPPLGSTCDLVIVRPMRDPSNVLDDDITRERYVEKIWKVMGGAYSNGSHINLRYDINGEVTTEGDGPYVVEYFRCGGWEWIPRELDVAAHLLCSDGTIFEVEKGGRALSKAATADGRATFTIYG